MFSCTFMQVRWSADPSVLVTMKCQGHCARMQAEVRLQARMIRKELK